ncbi:MAG: UDP-3-O-(3-hydroxymyristoyl)glucosamine N-acyltransferase [Gammaproteobacteria bacterium]
MGITLGELAVRIGAELRGDPGTLVERVATLESAARGDVSYLHDRRYRRFLKVTGASAVIVTPELAQECPVAALVVADAYAAYARASSVMHPPPPVVAGVHSSAVVAADARIDASARIGPHAVIEAGAQIGAGVDIGPGCVVGAGAFIDEHTRLVARVTIGHGVRIGRRCILQPGAAVGADGFGFARDGGRWLKIEQIGSVHLGDDVEVGCNSTIDRGALRDTVVEDGVKIDNLVQIGHNCHIGAHTAIAGCAGISGSVTIGKRCMIGGGVGINGHIDICDDVLITGFTMVTKSVREPGTYSSGWPIQPSAQWWAEVARLRRLAARDSGAANPAD